MSFILIVFGARLFLLDEFMDQSRYCPAAKTSRRLGLSPVRIFHEAEIERLFGSDISIVIEGNLAAFTALKIFCHDEDFLSRSTLKVSQEEYSVSCWTSIRTERRKSAGAFLLLEMSSLLVDGEDKREER